MSQSKQTVRCPVCGAPISISGEYCVMVSAVLKDVDEHPVLEEVEGSKEFNRTYFVKCTECDFEGEIELDGHPSTSEIIEQVQYLHRHQVLL